MNNQITAEKLSPITYQNIPVITTELLAILYCTEVKNIQMNHSRNEGRFVVGKHFFKLEGIELREFKNRPTNCGSVAKHTRSLILWTERGAARHAKMLETDQAWEVFEQLEDCYFNQNGSRSIASAAQPARYQIITTMEGERVISVEHADPQKVFVHPSECLAVTKCTGHVAIHYSDIRKMTFGEFWALVEDAERTSKIWLEKRGYAHDF